MQPKYGEYEEGWGSELLCPACDEQWTHHDRVEIFERKEDAETGVHVCVTADSDKAVVDENLDGNPSSRRNGLCVRFWCETCGAISLLSIAQHKGTTYVDFVDTGDKAPEG